MLVCSSIAEVDSDVIVMLTGTAALLQTPQRSE